MLIFKNISILDVFSFKTTSFYVSSTNNGNLRSHNNKSHPVDHSLSETETNTYEKCSKQQNWKKTSAEIRTVG